MSTITTFETADVRFPTSLAPRRLRRDEPGPGLLRRVRAAPTDAGDGLEGHGFMFTIGRGNDVQVAAIESLPSASSAASSRSCSTTWARRGASSCTTLSCAGSGRRRASCTWRSARWSTRCGTCKAKRAGKPLWQLLAAMTPGGAGRPRRLPLPDRCAHSARRRSTSCARPSRARAERRERCSTSGYPAYTTTPGWLGYDDEKLARLCREAVEEGFTRSSSRSAATSRTTCGG